MKTQIRLVCLAIMAFEFFVGVSMLAAYEAWIRPGAPRFHTAQAAAPTPTPVVAAPVAPPVAAREPVPAPVAAAVPAPAQATALVPVPVKRPEPARPPAPKPQAAKPAVKTMAQGTPQPAPKPIAVPVQAPPAPIASPIPRQLPGPAPAVQPAPTGDPMQRGIAALNSRDYAGALALFRQARQAQPRNPDLGYLTGLALENQGEFGAAIDAFRSCASGPYAQIAKNHVKMLVEKLRR